jgi:hypothetical protein
MDYNNISKRLQRLHASVNDRFNSDIQKHLHVDIQATDYTRNITVSIGSDDQPTLENKILIILHNLANFKDNLKAWLLAKGIDSKIVELEINNSLHLQVLIDIINQEKHGYPLTKSSRSGMNPVITDERQVLQVSTRNEPNSFAGFFVSLNGEMKTLGDNKVMITATIKDGHGNVLFSLDEMVEKCIERWEALINQYQHQE